jgi:hypothetical protein
MQLLGSGLVAQEELAEALNHFGKNVLTKMFDFLFS